MIIGNEFDFIFGDPMKISGFANKKEWEIKPLKVKDTILLQGLLDKIDEDNMMNNQDDENIEALNAIISLVFNITTVEDMKNIYKDITEDFFPLLMQDIRIVNDIQKTSKIQGGSNTTTWKTTIASLVMNGISFEQIKELTMFQFNQLVNCLQKKTIFDYKVNTVMIAKEPSKHLSDSDFPLYDDTQLVINKNDGTKKRVITMKEIMGFAQTNKE